jgi:hypothetical protein
MSRKLKKYFVYKSNQPLVQDQLLVNCYVIIGYSAMLIKKTLLNTLV